MNYLEIKLLQLIDISMKLSSGNQTNNEPASAVPTNTVLLVTCLLPEQFFLKPVCIYIKTRTT